MWRSLFWTKKVPFFFGNCERSIPIHWQFTVVLPLIDAMFGVPFFHWDIEKMICLRVGGKMRKRSCYWNSKNGSEARNLKVYWECWDLNMLLPQLRPPASKTSNAAYTTTRTTLWSSTSEHLEINWKFSNWLESNWHWRCYHPAKLRSQTFSSCLFLFWRHAVWEWLARAESWPGKKIYMTAAAVEDQWQPRGGLGNIMGHLT